MANLPERVIPDWKPQQIVTDQQMDDEFANIYYWLNNIVAAMLVKDANGRVNINVDDAKTLDGTSKEEIIAGQYPGLQESQAVMLNSFVHTGGVATKNGTTANQLDITAIVALFKDTDGKLQYKTADATTKTTSLGTTTYYLDFTIGGVLNFATSHPATTYLEIARVTTDSSGNIAQVTDLRELTPQLLPGSDANVDLSNTASITPDDSITSTTGSIVTLAHTIFRRLKEFIGGSGWNVAIPINLTQTKGHVDNTTNPHGLTISNLAVKDGTVQTDLNAQKLNDYTSADLLPKKVTFSDTTTAMTNGLRATKLLPLGSYNKVGGTAALNGVTGQGLIVNFTTVANEAKSIQAKTSAATFYNGSDGALSDTIFGTGIKLESARINGSNAEFVFLCSTASSTLNVASATCTVY